LRNNQDSGVYASGLTARAELIASLVTHSRPRAPDGTARYGVAAKDGASLELKGVRVHRNHDSGVVAAGAKSALLAHGLVVDATRSQPGTEAGGNGVRVHKRASAVVRGARVSGNPDAGVMATDAGTRLDVHDTLIDATRGAPASEINGVGVRAFSGAFVRLRALRVSGSGLFGVLVDGAGSRLDAADLTIDRTGPGAAPTGFGVGVQVRHGAVAELVRTRVSTATSGGVGLIHTGSLLLARELLVDWAAGAPPEGRAAPGLAVDFGARAIVSGARISGARGVGVYVAEVGAMVDAEGLLVDHTRGLATDGEIGPGLYANRGAAVRVAGMRMSGNRLASVMVAGMASDHRDPSRRRAGVPARALLAGAVIEATESRSDVSPSGQPRAPYGVGVLVQVGVSDFELVGSVVRANRVAGVVFDQAGGRLRETVIADTAAQKYVPLDAAGKRLHGQATVLADGIVARASKGVTVNDCLVHGNDRAGVLLPEGSVGTMRGSIVMGAAHGLAPDSSSTLDAAGNLLFGNTRDRTAGAGLSVPPAPGVIEVGAGKGPDGGTKR